MISKKLIFKSLSKNQDDPDFRTKEHHTQQQSQKKTSDTVCKELHKHVYLQQLTLAAVDYYLDKLVKA